jgi:hypothetical protein
MTKGRDTGEATLNRTYEPSEARRGVYATQALIAGLVALSALMLAVLPGGSSSPIPGLASQRAGGEGGSQEGIAPAPANLSFLCDPFTDYEETSVPAAEKQAAEGVAEEFVRSAYGYTGTDAGAYEEGINGQVVEDCFWESDAGEEIDESEEIVRRGGEANAPSDKYYFEGFVGYYVGGEERVHSESGDEYLRVYGHAVWVSHKARAEAGKPSALAGFQQGLTLTKRVGEREWEVAYGELVSAYPSSDYEHAIREKIEEIAAGE